LALDFRGRGVVWRLRAPLPDSQSCALCPLFVLTPAVAAMAMAAEQALHRGSFPFPAVREMIESPCLGSCAHGDSITTATDGARAGALASAAAADERGGLRD
jgi:hypothetical protein